jgi:hypothetical protein
MKTLSLFVTFTQARNTLIRRVARENVERRNEEKIRDTTSRRAVRDDEERREQEQV